MTPTNIALALQLLIQLLGQASSIGGLIENAQAQNRDVTDAELDQLVTDYANAHQKLDAAIASKGG